MRPLYPQPSYDQGSQRPQAKQSQRNNKRQHESPANLSTKASHIRMIQAYNNQAVYYPPQTSGSAYSQYTAQTPFNFVDSPTSSTPLILAMGKIVDQQNHQMRKFKNLDPAYGGMTHKTPLKPVIRKHIQSEKATSLKHKHIFSQASADKSSMVKRGHNTLHSTMDPAMEYETKKAIRQSHNIFNAAEERDPRMPKGINNSFTGQGSGSMLPSIMKKSQPRIGTHVGQQPNSQKEPSPTMIEGYQFSYDHKGDNESHYLTNQTDFPTQKPIRNQVQFSGVNKSMLNPIGHNGNTFGERDSKLSHYQNKLDSLRPINRQTVVNPKAIDSSIDSAYRKKQKLKQKSYMDMQVNPKYIALLEDDEISDDKRQVIIYRILKEQLDRQRKEMITKRKQKIQQERKMAEEQRENRRQLREQDSETEMEYKGVISTLKPLSPEMMRIVKNLTTHRHTNKYCPHCRFLQDPEGYVNNQLTQSNGGTLDEFMIKLKSINNRMHEKFIPKNKLQHFGRQTTSKLRQLSKLGGEESNSLSVSRSYNRNEVGNRSLNNLHYKSANIAENSPGRDAYQSIESDRRQNLNRIFPLIPNQASSNQINADRSGLHSPNFGMRDQRQNQSPEEPLRFKSLDQRTRTNKSFASNHVRDLSNTSMGRQSFNNNIDIRDQSGAKQRAASSLRHQHAGGDKSSTRGERNYIASDDNKSIKSSAKDRLLGMYDKTRHICSTNHAKSEKDHKSQRSQLNKKKSMDFVKLQLRPASSSPSLRDAELSAFNASLQDMSQQMDRISQHEQQMQTTVKSTRSAQLETDKPRPKSLRDACVETEQPTVSIPKMKALFETIFLKCNQVKTWEEEIDYDWSHSGLYIYMHAKHQEELNSLDKSVNESEKQRRIDEEVQRKKELGENAQDADSSLQYQQELLEKEEDLRNLNPQAIDIYTELEVTYMASILKKKAQTLNTKEMLAEIHKKSLNTLEVLTKNLIPGDIPLDMIATFYQDSSRENVIRLLLRCKKMYEARVVVKKIFKLLFTRDFKELFTAIEEMKAQENLKIGAKEKDRIGEGDRILKRMRRELNIFNHEHKIFKNKFLCQGLDLYSDVPEKQVQYSEWMDAILRTSVQSVLSDKKQVPPLNNMPTAKQNQLQQVSETPKFHPSLPQDTNAPASKIAQSLNIGKQSRNNGHAIHEDRFSQMSNGLDEEATQQASYRGDPKIEMNGEDLRISVDHDSFSRNHGVSPIATNSNIEYGSGFGSKMSRHHSEFTTETIRIQLKNEEIKIDEQKPKIVLRPEQVNMLIVNNNTISINDQESNRTQQTFVPWQRKLSLRDAKSQRDDSMTEMDLPVYDDRTDNGQL